MLVDTLAAEIGAIFIEKKSAQELYNTASDYWKTYVSSQYKDKHAGTIALELAVAACMEGYNSAGIVVGCLKTGLHYRNAEDNATSRQLIIDVYAEFGAECNIFCAKEIGLAYERGFAPYIVQSYYMSSKYFQMAADLGDVQAQAEMGERYFNAKGVRFDANQSEHYYMLAAKQGHVNSQYMLGVLYYGDEAHGFRLDAGSLIDNDKAGQWLAIAAQNGSQEAINALNSNFKYNRFSNKWVRIV